ncbi:galactokinase [Sinomonas sp. R1AF57]|uniref:galactokinase n=1 Tax=Sinomonas sp. R1AF57 TaxID=2020377 RepID=UPI000B608CCF|nr:galactokinase [Sinomonas sp. R1AF57]ASN53412.1 galactokinase [Sinomonas sp. R1AF57]
MSAKTMDTDPGLERVTAAFDEAFGSRANGVWTAPGRANLIGEHTDYNEGFVLPFAIDLAARAAIRTRDDGALRLLSTLGEGRVVELSTHTLKPGHAPGWSVYPAGVVWAFQERGIEVPGLDLALDSDVPLGAGLSSSHAIECAVATALNELTGAGFSAEELVLITQRAENAFVGAPTGIMDQSASLRGRSGHALFLDCRDQSTVLVPFDAAAAGLVTLVVDTRVAHSHADGGYADRRQACELGAQKLGVAALRDVSVADLDKAHQVLDEVTFRRVRHVVTENQRVLDSAEALAASGAAAVAPFLDASHASMRDDFEISCEELDTAVEASRGAGAIGARMTGGGFGGSAIALVPIHHQERVREAVLNAFARRGFKAPRLFTVNPSDGARRLA